MSQSMRTARILAVISGCLSKIFESKRCFFSRLIIFSQTSSRSAHFKFGSGHSRATLAVSCPVDPNGADVEVDGELA